MDGEEKLELSGHALDALREFYSEKDAQEKRFRELKDATDPNIKLSMEMFSEDWNASQFWYSDQTADELAKVLLSSLDNKDPGIAVVSAPSAYIQLKNRIATEGHEAPRVCLLEYDDRFSVLEGFVKYDFNSPFALPAELKGQFDRIICDPPYLNENCQTKAAMTVRWLSKANARVIVCTGERMGPTIRKLYPGIQRTSFEVKHNQDRLSNEFLCYANFECDKWKWVEPN